MAAKAATVEETEPTEVNVPMGKFRVGSVTASVWKNEKGWSVSLQKSYKDDMGDWQNTGNLFHGDVVCAIRALQRAEDYVARMQA